MRDNYLALHLYEFTYPLCWPNHPNRHHVVWVFGLLPHLQEIETMNTMPKTLALLNQIHQSTEHILTTTFNKNLN